MDSVTLREEEFFAYVKSALAAYDHHGGAAKNRIKYSRFEHTERVYRWMLILAEDFTDKIDMEALQIATIFHDIFVIYIQKELGEWKIRRRLQNIRHYICLLECVLVCRWAYELVCLFLTIWQWDFP